MRILIPSANVLRWRVESTPKAPPKELPAAAPATAQTTIPAVKPEAEGVTVANKFIGFLEAVGKDFEKDLVWAVKEAPAVGSLVTLLVPEASSDVAAAETGLNLVQNAVITVEQKYAAQGIQNGTGTQKLADVTALAGSAVTSLLTQAGVKNVTTDYIQSLISAVVSIMNIQQPPASSTVSTTSAVVAP